MKFWLYSAIVFLLAPAGGFSARDDQADRMRWFDEARFGLFIHWGPYAVPAGEWQGKPVSGIGEWIMKRGKISVKDYQAFAKEFTASKYDPGAWARLASEAGMKYVVITSKHHDGFALYDSNVTGWDVMGTSAAKRDLLAPLADAVRAEGLKFGLYYSQAQDWIHPGGHVGGALWDPAQTGDFDSYLTTIALPQIQEIVSRYQPDILWWDTPFAMTPARVKPFADYMAMHPAIINNDRLGRGFHGDTRTPEQRIPPRGYPGQRFEVCMTMNDTWGFKKNDHNWKSVTQLLRNLSDIASKGGNFLLNVGPTADGTIPPESVERLQAVGRWMKRNGEAIYGTQAGPFPRRLPWGRVTQKSHPDRGVTLYLHVWEWPHDGKLLLPTVPELPTGGSVIGNGAAVTWQGTADGLQIHLPGDAPDPDISIVRLDFSGPVTVTQEPFVSPDANGFVHFSPLDADAHGYYDGNIQVRGAGREAHLTDWLNPIWYLEYRFKAPRAQEWNIVAEVAAPEATTLTIQAGKTTVKAAIPATGPGQTWQTLSLGNIGLPSGETGFELRAVKAGWKPLSLRNLTLKPANEELVKSNHDASVSKGPGPQLLIDR